MTRTVCVSVEHNPDWLKRYDLLCNDLRTDVVNKAIGWWTKAALGATTLTRDVGAGGATSLIKSYSTLLLPGSSIKESMRTSSPWVARHYTPTGLVDKVHLLLVGVQRAMPSSEFCGVGVLVCDDASTLPMVPLHGSHRISLGGVEDLVGAVCNASMRSNPFHDGFHILRLRSSSPTRTKLSGFGLYASTWSDESRP